MFSALQTLACLPSFSSSQTPADNPPFLESLLPSGRTPPEKSTAVPATLTHHSAPAAPTGTRHCLARSPPHSPEITTSDSLVPPAPFPRSLTPENLAADFGGKTEPARGLLSPSRTLCPPRGCTGTRAAFSSFTPEECSWASAWPAQLPRARISPTVILQGLFLQYFLPLPHHHFLIPDNSHWQRSVQNLSHLKKPNNFPLYLHFPLGSTAFLHYLQDQKSLERVVHFLPTCFLLNSLQSGSCFYQ